MSMFDTCKNCPRQAELVCHCSVPGIFLCEACYYEHKKIEGSHRREDVLIYLSAEEKEELNSAILVHQTESIERALRTKRELIDRYIQDIKHAEQECALTITRLLEDLHRIKEINRQGQIPLKSDNQFVQSLASLKQESDFSLANITSLLNTMSYKEAVKWKLSFSQKAHDYWVYSVAISPCNAFIASASMDKTVKIWNSNSCQLLGTLEGHTGEVNSVVFLKNNIISASDDTTIKVWEGDLCVQTLTGHTAKVYTLSPHPYKNVIASGSHDYTVKIWEINQGSTILTLTGHSDSVWSTAFSPSGKYLASGSRDNSIKLWKFKTGELLFTINGHSNGVGNLYFHDRYVISGSKDGFVKFWRPATGELIRECNFNSIITAIDVINSVCVTLSGDNLLTTWDLLSENKFQKLEGHDKFSGWGFPVMGLAISKNGAFMVSSGKNGLLKIWRRV